MPPAPVVQLRITEIIGSSICVSVEDATRLHDAIVDSFKRGDAVSLSFAGIGRLTTAFLNAAIGQLYNEYSEDQVRAQLLPPRDATPVQLELLKKVVDNAKRFFADQARISGIIADTRGDA
jgi:hypothetical protein